MGEFRQSIDDMVFENRNKDYGSYQLRKKFHVRLAIGFFFSLVLFLCIALGYLWYLAEAGDEQIYMSSGSLPYLKTTMNSLLTQEEIDAYSGGAPRPEKPSDEMPAEKSASSSFNFKVTENAVDTFIPPPDENNNENSGEDMGLMVNDSTAFGGFLAGDGMGGGAIFDRIPEFPGGDATKYVERNLRYPAIAIRQKIHGIVIVSFVISKTGHVTNVKVERGVNPIIDEEAVKTIRNMPPWKPGMMNGKPINFMFRMPINFVPLG